MIKNKIIFIFLLILLISFNKTIAQENIITAGFQFKPIFQSDFFKTGQTTITQNQVDFSIKPETGFCAGMIIRRGITSKISFETGINYIKRNYHLSITDSSFVGESKFKIIGYEIPVLGLVFIRLGEKIYMDAALGSSIDLFPSDIYTSDSYFKHSSRRRNIISLSFLSNLGFEYRTEKNGYFYLGASYHRPFNSIYTTKIKYENSYKSETITTKLSGNYLTIDFRYFFNEDPIKKENKKKKSKTKKV